MRDFLVGLQGIQVFAGREKYLAIVVDKTTKILDFGQSLLMYNTCLFTCCKLFKIAALFSILLFIKIESLLLINCS